MDPVLIKYISIGPKKNEYQQDKLLGQEQYDRVPDGDGEYVPMLTAHPGNMPVQSHPTADIILERPAEHVVKKPAGTVDLPVL
eukprot:COSAG05_NODE_3959_length_1751_cov_26.182203_2_plen_83_part_00